MQCKTCQYPLWRIKARQCPECGSSFKPSDYDFVLNSVQFGCPHCEQPYFGTGAKGHLVPPEFNCVRCGVRIHMDQTVLLPTAGVQEVQTEAARNPWVNRRGNTWAGAWFRTIGMAVGAPVPLIESTPPPSTARRAFWFAMLTMGLYTLLGGAWIMAFPFLLVGSFASGKGNGAWLLIAVCLIAALLGPALLLVTIAAVSHAVLRLTGPTAGGFRRTAHAVWYSSGVNFLSAVPCLSMYIFWIGWVWWAIAAGFMIRAGQKVQPSRAVLAVLAPAVLGLLLVGGAAGGFVWWASEMSSRSAAAAISTMAATGGPSVTLPHLASVLDSAAAGDADGLPPEHAAFLLVGTGVQPLVINWADAATVPVGGSNLAALQLADRSERRKQARAAAAALPEGTIAHRLGDHVFTYHGVDMSDTQSGLWTIIFWPDADTGGGAGTLIGGSAYGTVGVGGTPELFTTADEFTAALAKQNTLRAEHGLAPLPHPSTVRHTAPAVAPLPEPEDDGG